MGVVKTQIILKITPIIFLKICGEQFKNLWRAVKKMCRAVKKLLVSNEKNCGEQ
jgi:hypothetical protein